MKKRQQKILELLDKFQELYGLDMIKASNGRLKRGLIYIDLAELEDLQLITSRMHNGRRLYKLSNAKVVHD